MKKIKVFVFHATLIGSKTVEQRSLHPNHEFMEITDELATYYTLIDCDTIDMVVKKIGDRYYNVVCDDVALYDPDFIITMIDPDYKDDIIAGTIVITGLADADGNLTDLTDDDAKNISNHIHLCIQERSVEGITKRNMSPVIFTNSKS